MSERQIYMLKRRNKKLTLTEVAKNIGCSQPLLSRWETGDCDMSRYMLNKYKRFIDEYGVESETIQHFTDPS